MSSDSMVVSKGDSYPPGAMVSGGGVNFSLYSLNAERVELLLFDKPTSATPARIIELTAPRSGSYHYWHCHVEAVDTGQVYGWRVHGPHDPARGHHFDGTKLLLDPYGRAIVNTKRYKRGHGSPDDYSRCLKSAVDSRGYDWEGDRPLERPFGKTVIYEMHVKGFTRHPSSGLGDDLRGTYRGLIEKIDYLVDLGVTAVELLPVFQFDPFDAPLGKRNYWGYSPISFFAPHGQYSSGGDGLAAVDEFRDMVKALHRAGIEVILDVVYNHTNEGDERGITQSFRGIDNETYYILGEDGAYANYSGCGNTVNANASIVRRLILDSLRYWVRDMHVDGFRFDLASILSRDEDGEPMASPPLLWDIETDPVLAGTKLIAEAWDAAGLYQVGEFFGHHWKEWNGKFRDDVRSFVRGDEGGALRRVAPRILGSPDIYRKEGVSAERSVNFVTSHDGFTLNDLVSYNLKHNLANGEKNRDGDNHNISWNHGVEGPTTDSEIEKLRSRQIRNFLTLTLVSQGVPMLLMGDEIRRSQKGNNNAYCQDNEKSWFDWSMVDVHAGLRRFVRELIRMRIGRLMSHDSRGLSLQEVLEAAEIRWHGIDLNEPDWSDHSHSIGIEVRGRSELFYLIMNAFDEPLEFDLPETASPDGWRLVVDTSNDAPHDIFPLWEAPPIHGTFYGAKPRSVVLLSSARNV